MDLTDTIEVFVRAACTIKSRYHPFVFERASGLWIMKDGPGRKEARSMEVVTAGMEPEEVVSGIAKANVGWHALCSFVATVEDADRVKGEFKRLGYRAMKTEWMFARSLEDVPVLECRPRVRQIADQEMWTTVPQDVGQKRKLFPDGRLFAVWNESRDYGWVESVQVGQSAWVSGLYVQRDLRRQGYGAALMSALLQDDQARGLKNSVLLASTSGSKLYPKLGYGEIGILQAFTPVRR